MSTASFTYVPEADYDYSDLQPGFAVGYAGAGTEQRVKLQTIARRRYLWHMRQTGSERSGIDTFFVARDFIVAGPGRVDESDGRFGQIGRGHAGNITKQVALDG